MLFTNCKLDANTPVMINGTGIERVYITKLLGVLVYDKPNWKEHISHIDPVN